MLNRNPTLGQVIRRAVAVGAINLRVSLPGKVISFNKDRNTVNVTPMIPETRHNDDDTYTTYELPTVYDVPVQFIGDSNFAITFPVVEGTECLLVFADRSLDKWVSTGENTNPEDLRRHDMSDAVCMLGVRSAKHAFPEVSTDYMQMGKVFGPKISLRAEEIHIGHEDGDNSTEKAVLGTAYTSDLQAALNALKSYVDSLNQAFATAVPLVPYETGLATLKASVAIAGTQFSASLTNQISNLTNDLSEIVKVS